MSSLFVVLLSRVFYFIYPNLDSLQSVGAYAASKAAVHGKRPIGHRLRSLVLIPGCTALGETLATELRPFSIRVLVRVSYALSPLH